MADEFGLDTFLQDIANRDEFLKTAPKTKDEVLPPVRLSLIHI